MSRRISTAWAGRGFSLHPADALDLFARKIRFVFNAGYISLNYSYPFFAYDARTLLALLFVGPWLLLPLGIVGLASGICRWRRGSARGPTT